MAALLLAVSHASAVEKSCGFCHAGHRGVMTLLNADIGALCLGCHSDRMKGGEHKVGVSPPMVVRDLPLHRGEITCITCHDPHGKAEAMLRRPPLVLCSSCHDK